MVLSKRERLIILATAIVVAMLVLDRYAVTPLLEAREVLEAQKQVLVADLARAGALLARKHQTQPKWKEMLAGGLQSDPAEAESQILHAVRNWSMEAGLRLSSVKPERLPEKTALPEIAFQAVGTGSMSAVSRFLWRLETAKVPIRVKELQVGARKEGTDDLTLQVRLSTLYLPAERPEATGAAAPARPTRSASGLRTGGGK
jgi:hypothetical protein